MNVSQGSAKWRVLVVLCFYCLLSYLARMNISIAAPLMMTDLSLNEKQIGLVFSIFLLSYTIFQLPAGWMVDSRGYQLVLGVAAIFWAVTSVITGLVGYFLSSGAVFASLMMARFALGVAEAPTYPASVAAIQKWFSPNEISFANSWIMVAANIAPGIATPLVAWLAIRVGWQGMFYITAVPATLFGAYWIFSHYQTQTMRSTDAPRSQLKRQKSREAFKRFSRDRSMWGLSIAYFFEGYAIYLFFFWFFEYLVKERGLAFVEGGAIASIPYFAAAFATPIGGKIADLLGVRFGKIRGMRRLVISANLVCAGAIIVGAGTGSIAMAIAMFALALAAIGATDSSYWAAATHYGGDETGIAAGSINTAGNLGGVVSTALAPWLTIWFGWSVTIGSCAIAMILCSLFWAAMREDIPLPTP